MKKKHSIGAVLGFEVVVFLAVFCLNVLVVSGVDGLGRTFQYYMDVPSILLIVLVVAPALFASGMGRDFLNVFSVGKKEYSLRQLKRSLESIRMVQKLIICGAALAGIISLVTILYELEDLVSLGPCLAVTIISAFYAVMLEFLLLPVKANVQNAITDLMDVGDEEV